jgi:hypothetical protein
MGTPIESISLNQNPETVIRYEVTCLFCGLPTPVPVPGPLTFACHVPRHISIVRCELCGKEAPYRTRDIVQSSAICRARRSRAARN